MLKMGDEASMAMRHSLLVNLKLRSIDNRAIDNTTINACHFCCDKYHYLHPLALTPLSFRQDNLSVDLLRRASLSLSLSRMV